MPKQKKKNNKQDPKRGYGLVNVEKRNLDKKEMRLILSKSWKDITPMELQKLVYFNWKTEDISKHFSVTVVTVLNKLRFT